MIPTDTQKIDYSWILLVGSSDLQTGCPGPGPSSIISACDMCHESSFHFRTTRDVDSRIYGSPADPPDLSEALVPHPSFIQPPT